MLFSRYAFIRLLLLLIVFKVGIRKHMEVMMIQKSSQLKKGVVQ